MTASIPHLRPRTGVLLMLAITLGALLGLGLAALYDPAKAAAPAPVTPVVFERIDAIPAAQPAAGDVDPALLAVAFGPGTDYSPADAAEVALTADRVREARAAHVPVDVQVATLVTTTGMLPDQARAFIAEIPQ